MKSQREAALEAVRKTADTGWYDVGVKTEGGTENNWMRELSSRVNAILLNKSDGSWRWEGQDRDLFYADPLRWRSLGYEGSASTFEQAKADADAWLSSYSPPSSVWTDDSDGGPSDPTEDALEDMMNMIQDGTIDWDNWSTNEQRLRSVNDNPNGVDWDRVYENWSQGPA